VQFVSKDPFVMQAARLTSRSGHAHADGGASPLLHLAKLPRGHAYLRKSQQLVGEYVKACKEGKGCHKVLSSTNTTVVVVAFVILTYR